MWNSYMNWVSTSKIIIYYFQSSFLLINTRNIYLRSVSFCLYKKPNDFMEKVVLTGFKNTLLLVPFSVIM